MNDACRYRVSRVAKFCTLAVLFAAPACNFADTASDVRDKPLASQLAVKQLPDSELIRVARDFVNLIASYQKNSARDQFQSARQYLQEPALTYFEQTMIGDELPIIERTDRSQIFSINTSGIKVERQPELDKVVVRLPGTRHKLIGNAALPKDELVYYIKMATSLTNTDNKNAAAIVDLRVRVVPPSAIHTEDKQEARDPAREAAEETKS